MSKRKRIKKKAKIAGKTSNKTRIANIFTKANTCVTKLVVVHFFLLEKKKVEQEQETISYLRCLIKNNGIKVHYSIKKGNENTKKEY